MESFIKKLYEYYEYVMGYDKNYYNENIQLDDLNLEDLELNVYDLSWVKQIVGRLMFQEEVFENVVSDVSLTSNKSEHSLKDNNTDIKNTDKEEKNCFSYGEFLIKNPGASRHERITAIRKFYKRVSL
jgi:hypothetical protein